MYIANGTRPDLIQGSNAIASNIADPNDQQCEQHERMLRYLLRTRDFRLAPGGSGSKYGLLPVWADSDFANCPTTRRVCLRCSGLWQCCSLAFLQAVLCQVHYDR